MARYGACRPSRDRPTGPSIHFSHKGERKDEEPKRNVGGKIGSPVRGKEKKTKSKLAVPERKRAVRRKRDLDDLVVFKRRKNVLCGECGLEADDPSAKWALLAEANKDQMDLPVYKPIQCHTCNKSYHTSCVGLTPLEGYWFTYTCKECSTNGVHQLLDKQVHAPNRLDPLSESEKGKPLQMGSVPHTEEMKLRLTDPSRPDYIPDAEQSGSDRAVFTDDFSKFCQVLEESKKRGWKKILVWRGKQSVLRLRTPGKSLDEILALCGPDKMVKAIDSPRQHVCWIRLGDYVRIMKEGRIKLNLISFEAGDTELARLILPPEIVRQLSLSLRVWPDQNAAVDEHGEPVPFEDPGKRIARSFSASHVSIPLASRFVILSCADAFTLWHIDISGSAVWNYVETGHKTFVVADLDKRNVDVFGRHNKAKETEVDLSDQLTGLIQINVRAGDTILMPGGIVHCVVTWHETIMYGGNFLSALSVPMQIHVAQMEERHKTLVDDRYAGFDYLHFYAAESLRHSITDAIQEKRVLSARHEDAAKALIPYLDKVANPKRKRDKTDEEVEEEKYWKHAFCGVWESMKIEYDSYLEAVRSSGQASTRHPVATRSSRRIAKQAPCADDSVCEGLRWLGDDMDVRVGEGEK